MQLSNNLGRSWSELRGVNDSLLCQQAPGGGGVGRCLGQSTALPLFGSSAAGLTLTSVGAVPDFYVYWPDKQPRDNFTQPSVHTVTLASSRRSLELRDIKNPIAYRGLPWPVYQFMSTSGAVVALADKRILQTVIVWYDKNHSGSSDGLVGGAAGRSPWPGPW